MALLAATVAGIALANSPWAATYFAVLRHPLVVELGIVAERANVLDWINEGAMALFFLVVGLEIKEALVHGELSSARRALLPVVAAILGVLGPLAVYLAFTWGTPQMRGWAIPIATDIAFVIGVLSAVPRVTGSLRAFTLGYSTTDDIIGVIVIAIVYTQAPSGLAIAAAAALLAVFLLFRFIHPRSSGVTVLLGVLAWFALLQSGVHAAVIGVPLGLLLAARPPQEKSDLPSDLRALADDYAAAARRGDTSECERLEGALEELGIGTESTILRAERRLRPWVTYLVLPAFALANAGVSLDRSAVELAVHSRPALGTFFGLTLGAPAGIACALWIGKRFGLGEGLAQVNRRTLAGLATLSGVGFTVALFIAELAFSSEPMELNAIKAAILAASTIMAILGYLLLLAGGRPGRRTLRLQTCAVMPRRSSRRSPRPTRDRQNATASDSVSSVPHAVAGDDSTYIVSWRSPCAAPLARSTEASASAKLPCGTAALPAR